MRHGRRTIRVTAVALAILLAAGQAARAGPHSQPLSPAERARRHVEMLVRQLGSADPGVRAAAGRRLAQLGPRVAPFLVARFSRLDPRVARRVRAILTRMADRPGPTRNGLTLSAMPIGRPQKGGAVLLWVTVRNATPHPVSLARDTWRLVVRRADAGGPAFKDTHFSTEPMFVLASGVPGWRLAPGDSAGYPMYADPADPNSTPGRVTASLRAMLPKPAPPPHRFELPEGIRTIIYEPLELASAPFTLAYAPDPAAREQKLDGLIGAWLKNEPGAEEKLLAHADSSDALRRGLRRAKAAERCRVFTLMCNHPRPGLRDALIAFLGYSGPQEALDDAFGALRRYARLFSQRERLHFFYQVARARQYDPGFVSALASERGMYYYPEELARVARILLLLPPEARSASAKDFLAWQLFANPDPDLHDPVRALKLMTGLVTEHPDKPGYAFGLTLMQGKRDEARRIAERVEDGQELNHIAWRLATAGGLKPADRDLAIRLAQKAVGKADTEFARHAWTDTLACTYAAAGRYGAAARTMEKALELMPAGDETRECYADRLIRFLAVVHTDPDTRRKNPTGVGGRRARDLLLSKLKGTTDYWIQRAVCDVLRESFPDDLDVRRAIETKPKLHPPPPPPKDNRDEILRGLDEL